MESVHVVRFSRRKCALRPIPRSAAVAGPGADRQLWGPESLHRTSTQQNVKWLDVGIYARIGEYHALSSVAPVGRR
jgi:hypothetical protein